MIYSLDFFNHQFYAKNYESIDDWRSDVSNNACGIVTKYGYFKQLSDIDEIVTSHNEMLNSTPPKLFIHTCRDCGAPFIVYQSELDYMKDKGYAPPKRCFICRKLRKGIKQSGQGC